MSEILSHLYKSQIQHRNSKQLEQSSKVHQDSASINTASINVSAEHGDTVNTASINVSDVGPSNVSTADPFTSIAGDILKMRWRATTVPTIQSQDKDKGKMVESEPTLKNPIKTRIQRDAEIAQRLFEEEQA
ncbi:hypothetical protein Tco_1451064 [Tanacetum coccineum]